MNFRKLAIAFAIALAVSGLCTVSLGHKLSADASQHKSGRHYVVPARALNPNEVLKADSVTVVDWPSDVEVPGAFTKPADLIGRTVLYPVDKGQPLTEKLVSAPGAGIGMASKIPNGMRAIALRTDEVIGVAGFLVPGSRLDVLATYRSEKTNEPVAVTVLQNAEVLAAGHQMEPDPDGKTASVTVVTLLLTPNDAEKAVMASTQGTIHFVMRSGSDSKIGKSAPVLLSALTTDLQATAPNPVAPPPASVAAVHAARHTAVPPAAQVITVQTVMGDKAVTNTFQVGNR